MAKSVDEAQAELDKEYRQFREELGRILVAVDEVNRATATDDIVGLLQKLEATVKDVRTGGILGSGANGHRAALEDWRRASGR